MGSKAARNSGNGSGLVGCEHLRLVVGGIQVVRVHVFVGCRVGHQHFRLKIRFAAVHAVRAFFRWCQENGVAGVFFHEVAEAPDLACIFVEKFMVNAVMFV